MKLFRSLYAQVIVAILGGIVLGYYHPQLGVLLKPLSDIFIRLVKMMIAPVVFCTIVTGIANMQDLKKVGRVGLKAVVYFEVLSTVALLIGLLMVNLLQPGKGMHINVNTLDQSGLTNIPVNAEQGKGFIDFLMNLVPENIIDALAKGNLLQVLFFAVLFGIALSKIGEKARPVLGVIQSFSDGLFGVIHIVMRFAPLGALGAMAFTVGKYGLHTLQSLGELMLTFYLTCIVFVVFVLGLVLKLLGLSIFKLLKFIKDELFVVLGTSSSESALPALMEKLQLAGCSKPVVGLVVPTGYSFNLDGTSIYLTMAAVFLSQAIDMPMSFSQQVSLLIILLVASKGAAGITGSGFITLAATLPAVGHIPLAALALIVGIDRFMSEARALTNIVGNATATIVIAKWEGELDKEKAAAYLR